MTNMILLKGKGYGWLTGDSETFGSHGNAHDVVAK